MEALPHLGKVSVGDTELDLEVLRELQQLL